MLSGMLDAVRGCLKEEMRMDVISNNLANSTVIGFKKDVISFQDLLDEANGNAVPQSSGGPGPVDSSLVRIQTDMSQGDVRLTGNSLDFAINGEGFFKVDTPDGIRYTRKGNFSLNREGDVVTQEGHRVLGEGGPINIPEGRINVNDRGVIAVDGTEVGRLDVVNFENSANLVKEGGGFYRNDLNEPEAEPPGDTKIQQEYLELSNVTVAEEMIQMIHSLRAFESYQKSIQILDGINNRAINEVSRLR